jgi:HNH endonuclease
MMIPIPTARGQNTRSETYCTICLSQVNLHKHRLKPGRLGGKYTKYNIRIVCQHCHAKIHAVRRRTVKESIAAYYTIKNQYLGYREFIRSS